MRTVPQVTGPTENALRALLERQLHGTRIPGYLAWVVLNYAGTADGRAGLEAMVLRDTKHSAAEVAAAVADQQRQGLLGETGEPTGLGRDELALARGRVRAATAKLADGIAEADLEVTYRVLDAVRAKAEALLAG